MNTKILIVEDDTDINNVIFESLKLAGYECLQAFSGTEGILLVKTEQPQLVILDLMLPGKNGEEVLTEIKRISNIPVIVISAKDGIDSKVTVLRSGAEDYLTKPFDLKELEVRVEVQLRRYEASSILDDSEKKTEEGQELTDQAASGCLGRCISYKELEIYPDSYIFKVNGEVLELTKHEFKILELLIKNPDRAFSKQSIYNYAWDDSYLGEDKTINVHISNIRKKLKTRSDIEYIDTVWGIGFKIKK